jgi:hypothetical protein
MIYRAVIPLCYLVALSVCLVLYPTILFLKLEVKRNDEVNGEGKRGKKIWPHDEVG